MVLYRLLYLFYYGIFIFDINNKSRDKLIYVRKYFEHDCRSCNDNQIVLLLYESV